MMARNLLLASLLASPVEALVLGTALRATGTARASPPTLVWDPMKDEVADGLLNSHNNMLQHTEEVVPQYVAPPPGYTAPEDGCEEVTLDSYASMVFGKSMGQIDAWICAEDESHEAHDQCNYVMHKGEVVWACI